MTSGGLAGSSGVADFADGPSAPGSMVAATDLCGLVGLDRGRVAAIVSALIRGRRTVATAESLTAGLLAAVLAEIPGVSAVLRGGIVCYATDLKHTLAGVDPGLLAERGAVDPEVARQLARGARLHCGARIGVGLTGVAGPDPQDGKPAGTVYVAAELGRTDPSDALGEPAAGDDAGGLAAGGADAGDGAHAPAAALLSELVPAPGGSSRWEVRAAAVCTAIDLLEELARR